MTQDPHRDRPLLKRGASLDKARGAVVLLHGRGSSADEILSLGPLLTAQPDIAFLAPQAADRTWYPLSFLAPREENEPFLSSALARVESVIASIEAAGISRDRIVIGGFSQGACLTTEFAATHPARYAALLGFTGGLVGPLGSTLTSAEGTPLAGTPVFLGSGDPDPHVPWSRVEETAARLQQMGAAVTLRHYPGRPHTISQEELALARQLVEDALGNIPAR